MSSKAVSLVVPAFNEASGIRGVIHDARRVLETEGIEHEIIVVNDGSTDTTASIAREEGAVVIEHPENLGYGAALKTGVRAAGKEWVAIVDADGTYPLQSFPMLLSYVPAFDMVVGARTGKIYRGGVLKRIGRWFFKWLSEFATGRRIPDINSGMRVFRRQFVLSQYRHISTGFSFTTTLTLSMMLEGKFVKYVQIPYEARIGTSRVRYWRDSLRAAQIIVQAILWYNPVKIFLLLASGSAVLTLAAIVLAVYFGDYEAPIFAGWLGLIVMIVLVAMGFLGYIIRSSAAEGTDAL